MRGEERKGREGELNLGEIGDGRMRSEAWTHERWEPDEKVAGRAFSKETLPCHLSNGEIDRSDSMGELGALHC